MPRMMSFAITTAQFKARTKTVTRRLGWEVVKAGDILQGVEKCQGIPKGGKVVKLGLIRVAETRREPLSRMTKEYLYGIDECRLEGFPVFAPEEFVAMFCEANGCEPDQPVTRIEYEYLEAD